METQQMLQEIQDKIGDRTLSTGCIVFNKEWGKQQTHKVLSYTMKENGEFDVVCDGYELYDLFEGNIIGHPISLERVLSALGKYYISMENVGNNEAGIVISIEECTRDKFYRHLLKKNNSDAMLSDQPDHTIKAIWEIVCK